MATFATMKTKLAAYMQRSVTSFTVDSFDILGDAVNAARKWAEMEHNFEMARVECQLAISLANGGDIANMKLLDGVTSVAVKSLIKGFLPMPDATGGFFPIDVISRDKHVERIQRHYETISAVQNVSSRYPMLVPFLSVVRLANTLYLTPNNATVYNNTDPVTVRFDAFKFLPDYSADNDTDFLLTNCENFMLLQSATQLNFFLKDDQRVPISESVLAKHWHAAKVWDSNMVAADMADANLD